MKIKQKYKKIVSPFKKFYENSKNLVSRRPHRSFRLTKRRDYVKSLNLPGYIALSIIVWKLLMKHKWIFVRLVLVYALLTAALVGMASQDLYTTLRDTINNTSGDLFEGNFGALGESGLLLVSAAFGLFNNGLNEVQQIYAFLLFIMLWLTTIWLLRSLMAGNKVIVRDGLYNSFSPLISTFMVSLLLLIQMLPLALAFIGYNAALVSGLLENGGVESMLFWFAAGGLGVLSLYWMSTTFIALVVVTIPGAYPLKAIRTAGDIVVGIRVRILLRLIWLLLTILVAWILVMIPVILIDSFLKEKFAFLEYIPIVPVGLLIVSSLASVWFTSYIYVLYRKIVDGNAKIA